MVELVGDMVELVGDVVEVDGDVVELDGDVGSIMVIICFTRSLLCKIIFILQSMVTKVELKFIEEEI